MKTYIPPVLITLALVCFALSPKVQAVVPAPDGGYPNFTTAEGTKALQSLTTGPANTAVGWFSLSSNAQGSFNTAAGAGALLSNTADANTAFGAAALLFNSTGINNTAVGAATLLNNTIGDSNTAVGDSALSNNTGSGNTALGYTAGNAVTTANNVICIGNNVGGKNVSDSCFIGEIRGVTPQNADAIPVLIDSAGQLGTASSSRRFKKEIKPMERASEAILTLKPVTFHYKSDKTDTPHFGLIAEEVAEVNPDLVVRDEKGEIYTVRYDAVNAMLLNEFLKEHRIVREQGRKLQEQETTIAQQRKDFEATISELKKRMETLAVRSKEQDVKIQKVSDRIELTAAAKQLAVSK
jgi:Chaperone of endosialidase